MRKRQCQAFVESKGRQCEKTIRWGKKYCWWHYPKGGPISALILGALLGLIFTLLFSQPIRGFLSPHWPFHYLDRNAPTIVAVLPDIRASDYVDAKTRTLSVTCRDDCSGLDLARSRINLYRVRDNEYEPLSGKSSVMRNRFEYMRDTDLTHGEYFLRITVCDRAKNRSESEYPFVVPEEEIIAISALCEQYDEAKHENLFRSFLDERAEMLDLHRYILYVYYYGVRNKAEKTYCRNLHFDISSQGVVFCWKETASVRCNGIVSVNFTEAMVKNVPKNMVFTSERMLSIDEVGPGGLAHFAALVGFMKFDSLGPKVSTPTEIGVFGTYVSQGYARTTTVPVRRWIPIKKRNSAD
jgi:hypothetical protein